MAVSRCQLDLDEDRANVARQKKDQGFHECEIFGTWSLEYEQNYAWNNCEKSKNDHANFIPILNFSEQNLPTQHQGDGVLLQYILAIATLTVRIRVNHVSVNRPDGYTFSSFRNQGFRRSGTGWVYKISSGDGPCPCTRCKGMVKSNGPWWKVEIFTACHVVYDQVEAKRTEADFFYDSKDSVVTTLYGHDVEDNSVQDDVCIVHCISHDLDLVRRLKDAMERYERLKWDVRESSMSTLCFVISHPHGESKKVTVGEIVGNAKYDPEESMLTEFMYTYTADTCNGSSGAPILTVVTRKTIGSTGVWPGAGPHSGHVEGALNQCGSGSFYVGADALDKTMLTDSMKKLKKATTFADVNFILIGKTGVGKSALGNSIVGKTVFATSDGVESVTTKSDFAITEINKRIIKVVDMLGVGDTRFSAVEGFDLFLKQLNETMSVSAGKSHIFLLVFRFGTRFTREDEDTIAFLKNVLGSDFVRYNCIIVMTYGDNFVNEEEKLSFKEWCQKQYGSFKELIDECEGRILLFDNKTKSEIVKKEQIEELLRAASLLHLKERRYTELVFSEHMDAHEKMFVQMHEPEVREKVLQEEAILLQELRQKRSDTHALQVLFMRAESLMRYVKSEDRGTGALQHLVDRVATLRKTVEESFTFQNNLIDWMTQTTVKEVMAEEEIRLQKEWFDAQLGQISTAGSAGLRLKARNLDLRR